jgi:broad specificity phosphatase PhoE
MTEVVILARHGESTASARGLVNGDPRRTVGLSGRGREEARRLGEQIGADDIDLCVVTQFPRTTETADIALASRSVPRLVVEELNDPRVGDLEGGPIEDLREWFRRNGALARIPGGGEHRVEVVRRYGRGLRRILDRTERAALVIAHGLPVTYAVRASRGEDLPLTLEGVQVDHAVPYRLSRADVERAIAGMERWARKRDDAA